MQHISQYLTGAAFGAITAVAVVWGLRLLNETPPVVAYPTDETVMTNPTPAATSQPRGTPSLARIEARLSELEKGIRSLDQKIDSLAKAPDRTPISPRTGKVVIDEDAIVRAMERVEEKKFNALSIDDLIMQSKRQLKLKDLVAARRTLEALAARAEAPKDRAFALTQLGILHRTNGDLKGSARVLESAVREFGVDTENGRDAAFQLLWTRCKAGEHAAATQLSSTLANSPNVPETMRVNARWASVVVAQASGDANGARAGYEAFLREYGNNAEYRKLVEDVRRRLQHMK
jgi:hypothetical protein